MLEHTNIVEEREIHDEAAEIALLSGCRAIDAYYIATAKRLNAVLVTSDRIMRKNALKVGIETYYPLDNQEYNSLKVKLSSGEG